MRGIIKVVNFWVVMDSGFSVQPRHLIAEVEGSIIYGLGHVLREEITIKGGHVQQSNFTDYEPLRTEETPEIKVEVISSENRIPVSTITESGPCKLHGLSPSQRSNS